MALDRIRLCELEEMQSNDNERVKAAQVAVEGVEQEEVEVAIVGGGLAGLALLLALQTRGVQAHLFEKYANLRSDTATVIGIGPNGVTALEGVQPGLSKIIAELGTFTTLLKFDTSTHANEVSSKSVTWPDASYITVNWKEVQQALAKHVCADSIHSSHELVFYKPMQDGHVHACFDVKHKEGMSDALWHFKVVRTQLLVGADGIWSAVRKQMMNDEPRYLHMVDWNAVVYDPHQKVVEGVRRGEIYQKVDPNTSTTFLLANAGDYALWILRKVDENGELGKSLLRKQGSFGDPRSKARALQQISGCEGYDVLKKAIEASDERSIFERKIMDRLPLDKWSDADGHVLLIGDAAHAQYVGPGQGARTAFEDAHQLALLLENAKHSGFTKESIQTAVYKFEELRIPRMRKMQEYAVHSTQQARFQPEWVQKLSPEEAQKRRFEYMKWVESYPKNQQGDPESTYFK